MHDTSASDEIRKALFHLPKLMNSKPQEKNCNDRTHHRARKINLTLAAQEAPAKSIDHPYHWIGGISRRQFCGMTVELKPTGEMYKPNCTANGMT